MPSSPSALPLSLTLSRTSKALLLRTPAVQASSSTHTHAPSAPFSATPSVSHLPSKKNYSKVTSSKTKKNNTSSIAFNELIPK